MLFYTIYVVLLISFALTVYKLFDKKYVTYYSISAIYAVTCIGCQFAYSISHHMDKFMFMFLISSIPALCQYICTMIYINIDEHRQICCHIIMTSCLISYIYLFIQIKAIYVLGLYYVIATVISCFLINHYHEDWSKPRVFMNSMSLVIGSSICNMIFCVILEFLMPYVLILWLN